MAYHETIFKQMYSDYTVKCVNPKKLPTHRQLKMKIRLNYTNGFTETNIMKNAVNLKLTLLFENFQLALDFVSTK